MIRIPGYQIKERPEGGPLYESGHSMIFQGVRESDQQPVVLKFLKQKEGDLNGVTEFHSEYEMTRSLQGEGVIETYGLESYKNQWFMILEDFGGKPLSSAPQLSLELFLKIAIRITDALERLHQNNVMHKDINPSNILYNPQTDQVKLIDFGISTSLSRETSSGLHPTNLEGTLPYMSPEQTGRMNRAMDYRTDFYSLGVTFYEMLTGKQPFPVDDAMALVHCHLAKLPAPPHQQTNVPPVLSEIILKLMAKQAEDRYQSTLGLKADLEVCLKYLNNQQSEELFHIGENDISDRFQIPQKLYGRENEIDILLTSFDRVGQGTKEMVVVTGHAGIGKSTLVHEIHKPIVEKQGYFISGKFDQFRRDIPFACLIHAFQGLIRQLLSESESQIAIWKQKLLEAFGSNGRVISDVIPEVEFIVGPQPPLEELPRTEAQNRFNYVFQNFIRALSTPEHPLAIFLDDLQWADPATLQLLELFMCDTEIQGLFVIGAYRDNEMDAKHILISTLESLQEAGVVLHSIHLSPLPLDIVNRLIADTFQCSLKNSEKLAQVCFEKTQGNPFFLSQFLHSLYVEGLVEFATDRRGWLWRIEAIYQANITDNVVELMAQKIQQLPQNTQQVLQWASCLGSSFELKPLALIYDCPTAGITNMLSDALQEGLILKRLDHLSPTQIIQYKFSHDRIQEAAYSFINEKERATVHLKIGRLLLQHTSVNALEENPFDVTNHWNKALDLIELDSEKRQLAELNLKAGQKAKKTLAYSAAVKHLKIATSLLSEAAWQADYPFIFDLYVELAEAHYLNIDFELADQWYCFLLDHAETDEDLCRVHFIQLKQLMVEGKYAQMIEVIRQSLKLFQIDVPRTEEEASQFFEKELAAFPKHLAKRNIEKLSEENRQSDEQNENRLSLLGSLSLSAYFLSQIQLYKWSTIKGATLCLQHGHNKIASFSYINYATVVLAGFQKDYKAAHAYGKMAVSLSDRYRNSAYQGGTYHRFATYINPMKNPISDSLEILRKTIQIGTEGGDFLYAGYSVLMLSIFQIIAGHPLAKIRQELEKYLPFMRSQAKAIFEGGVKPHVIQTIKNLEGMTVPGSFSDLPEVSEPFDEQVYLQKIPNPVFFALYHCTKIRSLYLFGQYQEAINHLDDVKQMAEGLTWTAIIAETYFYMSLTITAILNEEGTWKPGYFRLLKGYQEEMKNWADHAPANFAHKYWLVEAERAKLSGQIGEAMRHYKQGVASAKEHQFLQVEALGNELYARFWLEQDEVDTAKVYFFRAHAFYEKWGASGKVKQLETQYPHLLHSLRSVATRREGVGSDSRAIVALDLDAIIKASQALSEEINLEKVLGRLMQIIIENTGAQKGFLLLKEDHSFRVEACIDSVTNEVHIRQTSLDERQLPLSIIRFVTRTGELVRIDDATGWQDFAQDPYFGNTRPQAILCIPMKKKERLDGALYLENDVTSGVFTEDRIQMLEILLSQATISIENARLYDNLEEKVQERTEALQQALSQLEETNTDLKHAKDSAESANRSKSNFLANMSHEIRTPMNAILGFTELLEALMVDDQQKSYLKAIRSSGKSLLTLINDILDLSKVEAGKLTLEYAAVDPYLVFQEMEMIFSKKIADKGLTFLLNIDPELPKALILDEVRLRQILLNLIGNAIKFTNSGLIQLSISKRYPHEEHSTLELSFAVEDTGIGIPKDQQELIFSAFEQQSGQAHSEYGGTGLGLAITKRLVEMMEGTISVESELGEGSKFNILFYNVKVATTADLKQEPTNTIDLQTVSFEPATILVVDDIEVNRSLVINYLEPYQLRFLEAANGEEAIQMTQQFHPDLILMDMKMPIIDGYAASRQIKENPKHKDIPIVALTASVMQRKEEDFVGVCEGYLRKPTNRVSLVLELMKFLKHSIATPKTEFTESEGGEHPHNPFSLEGLPHTVAKETLQHLPDILTFLKDKQTLWETLCDALPIDTIEHFGKEAQATGIEFHYLPLEQWGELLQTQANNFQLDLLPKTLSFFPKILNNVQMLSNLDTV